jgi:hypothetical protein
MSLKKVQDDSIEPEIAELAKMRWYVQGFSASMNFIAVAPYSGIEAMHEVLGYGYHDMILVVKKEYMEYHYSEEDLENAGNEFFRRYNEDRPYLAKIEALNKKLAKEYLDVMIGLAGLTLIG